MQKIFIDNVLINVNSVKEFTETFEVRENESGNVQIDYYDAVGTLDATIKLYVRNNPLMYWVLVTTILVSTPNNESNSTVYQLTSPFEEIKVVCALNNATSFKLRSSIAIG